MVHETITSELVQLPELGAASDGGLEMMAGTVLMGPVVVVGNIWAGRPIVWD